MRRYKCIQHIWENGSSNIPLVFKYGRFVMCYEVCRVCGKTRIANY